jgi:pyruvate, water dikinase
MWTKNLFRHWTYQVFAPGTVLREKYEAFQSLLANDQCAHELMAELETIHHRKLPVDANRIQTRYASFAKCVGSIVSDLKRLCPSRYLDLNDYFSKFDFYIRFLLAAPEYEFGPPFILHLNNITKTQHALVGGKAQNLAEIKKELHLPVPDGFVITTNAFHYVIEYNNLKADIDEQLSLFDPDAPQTLEDVSKNISALFSKAEIPADIAEAVYAAYDALAERCQSHPLMAVRSSAVGEDSRFSFAGQYTSVLNVPHQELLAAYKQVLASKYRPEAIFYRINFGFSDADTPMAVVLLPMVAATVSGVMFTQAINSADDQYLSIHAVPGLGEALVSGAAADHKILLTKTKPHRIPPASPKSNTEKKNNLPDLHLEKNLLNTLATWGLALEDHYRSPQDVEWCQDDRGRVFILQSRPLPVSVVAPSPEADCPFADFEARLILTGAQTASQGVTSGQVFRLDKASDLAKVPPEAVLVTQNAGPQYVTALDRVRAVVAEVGSAAGHFPSVAREFGVPMLINATDATRHLKTGQMVTVHADSGAVYAGEVAELLKFPCRKPVPRSDSPLQKKLDAAMAFVSPLKLTDPHADNFNPQGCRSMHDIIRFAHEKAVYEMFSIGNRRLPRKMGARKLETNIPLIIYVLDVGGGLAVKGPESDRVKWDEVTCAPMHSVWQGLSDPAIRWESGSHFDWAAYDKIVMSGGIISADSPLFSSYAVVSNRYLNFSLKFGYHFVILDTVCGSRPSENHILFRFSGGGGDLEGRFLRARVLEGILDRLGLSVKTTGDLIEAQLKEASQTVMAAKLVRIGQLLGATRLMDMRLHDENQVQSYIDDFMQGRYDFASENE